MFGFHEPEDIFDGIMNTFYDEENLDEDWIREQIFLLYEKHQEESNDWQRPTDFDKLVNVFNELVKRKIIALHLAGYTKQDGYAEVAELNNELKEHNINPIGFCFYHAQDLARAINPDIANLYLAFDSTDRNDEDAVEVGKIITRLLREIGFSVKWNETVKERILIEKIDWKKADADVEYGMNRVFYMFIENE